MADYLKSFLNLLHGGIPEHAVWTADPEYWITGREVDGTADAAWRTEDGYLKLCQGLQIMPYYWYQKFWLGTPQYDQTVTITNVKDGRTTRTTYSTPIGRIVDESSFVLKSASEVHNHFPVETEQDLEVFGYLIEHRLLRPSFLDDYHNRERLWREYGGVPSVAMPRSPLAAFFYEWAGIENGVYLLMDYPDKVQKIFDLMSEQETPVIEEICKVKPAIVHFADNMSADNMAGLYEEYMAGTHERRIQAFHDHGIACAVHLDGTVRNLLGKVAAVGFDLVEALTPEPGGDLPVEQLRSEAGSDTVVLWGGVPGILFAPPYSWQDMENHVRKVLREWRGTRFVLGVADQIPPDGNIEFCPRIAELLDTEGL